MQTQNLTHIPVTIPQMGEGLIEARIATFFKHAGEEVRRDEPLLEVETDKAVLVIEAAVAGVVGSWQVAEDDLLPIGAVIGHILCPGTAPVETVSANGAYRAQPLPSSETHERHWAKSPAQNGAAEGDNRNAAFSPRVRLYCEGHGVSYEEMLQVPRPDAAIPLSIADVESWLHTRTAAIYRDSPLSARHKTLNSRLSRAREEVIAAHIEVECRWDALETARTRWNRANSSQVGTLDLLAWCVAETMGAHPKFRSALIGEHTLREYRHAGLGVAVGLPDDELTTASVARSEDQSFGEFAATLRTNIERARQGHEFREPMQLIITKLSRREIFYAVPIVVPPAMASLFVGAPYDVPRRNADDSMRWEKVARLVLSFDHRLVNGMGASQFLLDLQSRLHQLAAAGPQTH